MQTIKEVNNKIRIIKKLKGIVFLLEETVWDNKHQETARLDQEIRNLEKRKQYIKRHDEIAKKKAEDPNYQPNNYHNSVSIEEIKSVPIRVVLESRGITYNRNNMFKIRNEKTPSAQFNDDKNVFYDHGDTQKGGSVIDLIMALENLSTGEAIKFIKERYL